MHLTRSKTLDRPAVTVLLLTLLFSSSGMSQNQGTPPPGVDAPPNLSEIVNSTLNQYAPLLENMTESELAEQDKSFKQFMRWRTYMEQRVHPEGTLIDYWLMKQNYANNTKSNYESAGDWYELGPYSRPSG